MSQRADASQCGGVVVEFESDDIRNARTKKARSIPGELYFKSNYNLCSVFVAFIMCAYSIFMHFLVRFSSYLPQGSQVSHLCQWSIVNVGKNHFLKKQIPGEIDKKSKLK